MLTISLFSFILLFKLFALWTGIKHIMGMSKHNLKKVNEKLKVANEELNKANKQVEEMKKKLADKDATNKLHVKRMRMLE